MKPQSFLREYSSITQVVIEELVQVLIYLLQSEFKHKYWIEAKYK